MTVPRHLLAAVLTASLAACSGSGPWPPSPPPSPGAAPTPARTREASGAEHVVRWAAAWKDAFQRLADDLSGIVQAVRERDVETLRARLRRLPGDAHQTLRDIDRAGPPPPALADEVRRLKGLVAHAADLGPQLAGDCLRQAGLACAADAATFLDVAGRILEALRPFGVDIRFRVDL